MYIRMPRFNLKTIYLNPIIKVTSKYKLEVNRNSYQNKKVIFQSRITNKNKHKARNIIKKLERPKFIYIPKK